MKRNSETGRRPVHVSVGMILYIIGFTAVCHAVDPRDAKSSAILRPNNDDSYRRERDTRALRRSRLPHLTAEELANERLKAYAQLSSVLTSFAAGKKEHASYTVEHGHDVCTILVRDAAFSAGRIVVHEWSLPFAQPGWSVARATRDVTIRGAHQAISIRSRTYTADGASRENALKSAASIRLNPAQHTAEGAIALQSALERMIGLCKKQV